MSKYFLFGILFLSFFCYCLATVDEGVVDKSMKLTINSDRSSVKLNSNRYVIVNATIKNMGVDEVSLVLPGDGSGQAWRTPIIKWSVVGLDDSTGESKGHDFQLLKEARCGNVSPLLESDLITLAEGQSIELSNWIGYPLIPQEVGKYVIRLSYENDPKIKWQGLGFRDKKLLNKVKQTDGFEVVSNAIYVEVIE